MGGLSWCALMRPTSIGTLQTSSALRSPGPARSQPALGHLPPSDNRLTKPSPRPQMRGQACRTMKLKHPLSAQRGSELAEYLRQIRGIPLLTPDEERTLIIRTRRDGCEASRTRLVLGNLRLA